MIRNLIAIAALAALAACASTPPTYTPAAAQGAAGY
jgi:predicted small lipoprotein YifL